MATTTAIVKTQIANLALSRLGNYDSLSDIEIPVTQQEKVFAKWYETARKFTIRELEPSFAKTRRMIAKDTNSPPFGYTNQYVYPSDCLKVLGFGEIAQKRNVYSIEGNFILTDEFDGEALPLRFIEDTSDVTKFTPEFVILMSFMLAYYACMEITQDKDKLLTLEKLLPTKKGEAGAIDGQENRPIRITRSLFKEARISDFPVNSEKL